MRIERTDYFDTQGPTRNTLIPGKVQIAGTLVQLKPQYLEGHTIHYRHELLDVLNFILHETYLNFILRV